MLPEWARPALTAQLAKARALYDADRAAGAPGVELPHALAEKMPHAPTAWHWFWVFPSPVESRDAARPPRRADDHDLYARDEPARPRGEEPAGCRVRSSVPPRGQTLLGTRQRTISLRQILGFRVFWQLSP